jgi:hypothetical protein
VRTATVPPKALSSRVSANIQDAIEPKSVKEAIHGPHSAHWIRAMNDEWDSLIEKNTFKFSNLPENCHTVGCKWVLTLKCDASGQVTHFKARLVAQGFSQIPGVDYNKTFASVVTFSLICLLCAYAAAHDHTIYHVDVKTT